MSKIMNMNEEEETTSTPTLDINKEKTLSNPFNEPDVKIEDKPKEIVKEKEQPKQEEPRMLKQQGLGFFGSLIAPIFLTEKQQEEIKKGKK